MASPLGLCTEEPLVHLNLGADMTIITARGQLEPSELLSAYSRFLDAGENTSPNVLWDLSSATMATLTSTAIHDLAAALVRAGRVRRRPGKSALVCGRDVDFGLARMLTILVSDQGLPVDFRVSRDVTEAKAWLTGEAPRATSA